MHHLIYLESIEFKVSDLQANAILAQKGKHQTRLAEVLRSILNQGNILLLEYFIPCSKESDIANFV